MSTSPPDVNPSDPEPEAPSIAPAKVNAKRRRTIILVAVLGGLVGTGAYFKWSAVRAESDTRSAQAALAADGIAVIETNAEPDDTASPFQSWDKPTIVRIQSSSKTITDAELPKIAVISQDINLVLSSCPVTNDGLSSIAGKNNVRCLSLAKTAVNDDGMKHLKGMNLQSLDLSATKITDAGLATLGECDFPRLKEIALERTGITDAGLMHLAGFKHLEWVSTAGTKVTRDGIRHLKAKLPEATILR
jgi:Leucine Rich repeat